MPVENLSAENLRDFEANENRVLILGKSDCEKCSIWQAELDAAMESGEFGASITVGKLNLDQRGLGDFKKENTWLRDIDDLPFNVIYKANALEKSYVGGGLGRLVNRLQRLELG